MKRQWQTEELVEQFTLLPDEMALLDNKVGVNQLGFAVLLKFFQLEARFPRSRQEVPKQVVSYIARQLELSQTAFESTNGRDAQVFAIELRFESSSGFGSPLSKMLNKSRNGFARVY
jgi:hypothetical protein